MTRGSLLKIVTGFYDPKSMFHKRKKDKKVDEYDLDNSDTEGEASEPKNNKGLVPM